MYVPRVWFQKINLLQDLSPFDTQMLHQHSYSNKSIN